MNEIRISRGTLQEIQEMMCDDYCYYAQTSTSQEILDKHCEECPLNNITVEKESR